MKVYNDEFLDATFNYLVVVLGEEIAKEKVAKGYGIDLTVGFYIPMEMVRAIKSHLNL